jgi:hypothetical protein
LVHEVLLFVDIEEGTTKASKLAIRHAKATSSAKTGRLTLRVAALSGTTSSHPRTEVPCFEVQDDRTIDISGGDGLGKLGRRVTDCPEDRGAATILGVLDSVEVAGTDLGYGRHVVFSKDVQVLAHVILREW